MIREKTIELKRDFAHIKRYIKFWFFILFISGALVVYNQYYFKVSKEIIELTQMKNRLITQNTMLKKEISRLSSPERINRMAVKKLKMKPVDYSKVHFIEAK
ncbi:cell division protein FtsL [Persephonella atlantica]|uniref:Cell division protein FtsL n=1 Tax=Persephonella atlantica TaxID=2699429 RepID=A0ABS1GFA4_9AQUI|nr:cell division protein FtsL [Persephonella atlantica]MBK3331599.1 cell division protein FtsL [Persephonella atlantica]